ncbi:MAG: hypothetical protein ACFFD2_20685 [Promethearchaeota archaeon]
MLTSMLFPTFWTAVRGINIEHMFYWMFGLFVNIDAGTITIQWLFNFKFGMYQLWYFIAIYSTLVIMIFSIVIIILSHKLKKEGKVKRKFLLLLMNESIIFAIILNLILINYLFIPIYGFHLLLLGVILSIVGYKKSKI